MNRSIKIGMAMLAMLALAGCGSNKQTTSNSSYSPRQDASMQLYIPCSEESQDDDNSLRALGIGESSSMQLARADALNKARKILLSRNENKTIDDATIICEKMMRTEAGHYQVYIVLEIAKASSSN